MNNIQYKSLAEINRDDTKTVFSINATVTEVLFDGNPESRQPIKFMLCLEDSGESVTAATWDFGLSAIIKMAENELNVYTFNCVPSVFNNELQLKVQSCFKTEMISNVKSKRDEVNTNVVKAELEGIVTKYITSKKLKDILNIVLNIPEFYTRPAASKVHHNYIGGLAKHTLGVTKIAMSLYRQYYQYTSIEMVIAGSILHDIGKIYEYTNEGGTTYEGCFMGHIPMGISLLTSIANSLGYDMTDPIILQLISFISSHHGSADKGSPSNPATLEAIIIHYADEIDACMENSLDALSKISVNQRTNGRVIAANNSYLMKVNNNQLLSGDK